MRVRVWKQLLLFNSLVRQQKERKQRDRDRSRGFLGKWEFGANFLSVLVWFLFLPHQTFFFPNFFSFSSFFLF